MITMRGACPSSLKPLQGLEPWTPALRKLSEHFPLLSANVLGGLLLYSYDTALIP